MANGYVYDNIFRNTFGMSGFQKWYYQFFVGKLYGRNRRHRLNLLFASRLYRDSIRL